MMIKPLFFMIVLLALPFKSISQNLQLADSLHHQGIEYNKKGNYRQAEFYVGAAFQLYKDLGTPDVWLIPGIDYAEILVNRSKYKKAIELFGELTNESITQKNTHARGRIENDLGWAYHKMGQNQKALIHLKKALPLSIQVKDTLRLGYIYNNISSIYYERGDYKKSLDYYKQSLFFKRKSGDLRSISIALNNIGLSYKKLSLYDKSLSYYEQGLEIRKKLGDIDLLSSSLVNLAGLYKSLGQYNKALVYYKKGLNYSQKSGALKRTSIIINNIGTLYNILGQPERALEYYRQSLKLKKQFADPSSLAVTYSNIAERLWDLGRTKESIDFAQRALLLRKKAGNANDIASSLLDLARKKLASGNDDQASNLVKEATALADSTQYIPLRSQIALVKGSIYFENKAYAKALASFKKAYAITKKLLPSDQLVPLREIAVTYHKMGSEKALAAGKKMVAIIEKQRSQAGAVQAFKTNYFKKYSDFYIQLASWVLAYHQNLSQAYHLIEAAKARSLSDELASAAQHTNENLPEKERIERAEKITAINKLYAALQQTDGLAKQAQIKKKLRQKELNYASYENDLHTRYPLYKLLKQPTSATLKQAQNLCGSNTAILEYAVGKETLVIFFITADSIKAEHFEISSNSLAADIKQFRQAILSKASKDTLAARSKNIYSKLVQPFESQLSEYQKVMIIPDGPITYLPFEALIHRNQYLVRTFTVKYAPSITSFLLIPAPQDHSPKSLLAIANASSTLRYHAAPHLPSANIEIDSIATYFHHVTTLKNRDVNEGAVKTALQKKHSFIHIAAHSIVNEQNPSLSGIILARKKNELGTSEDGFLNSSEIYRLNIHTDMVVLSACESGIGRLIHGEGMLGLQRAFFVAGASTVVVSLWNVYDRSTAHFMQQYYKALMHPSYEEGLQQYWTSFLRWIGWDEALPFGDKASAMRQAKLAMLQNPVFKDPVYWAPFTVVGR